jgi:D-alanyl-D-alanine dipeptidase
MNRIFIVCLTLALTAPQFAYSQNCPFPIINTLEAYKKAVLMNKDNELVEIKKEIPSVVLDITYATAKNIAEKPVYTMAAAFARKQVVASLKKIQQELNKQGLGLKIFDGYRPYAVTCLFYAALRDTTFVAPPWRGSKHNRGCALDLTVIDLKTGKELDMPSAYDEATERSYQSYDKCSPLQSANRKLLRDVMTANGFQIYPYEWWHFDFVGWEKYEIMDIDFEVLVNSKFKVQN